MGYIPTPFYIAGIFQCSNCCHNAGFHFRNCVIPSGLSAHLQHRATDPTLPARLLLDCMPDLLYFVHAQPCLIQQHKVLIQVFFVEQDIAFRLE